MRRALLPFERSFSLVEVPVDGSIEWTQDM
jgi:hypothetical protein